MDELSLCRCGCGNLTKVATRTSSRYGWVKGQPLTYLRGHSAYRDRGPRWIENENGCWIWQRTIDPQGYARGSFMKLGYGPGSLLVHRVLYMEKYGGIPDGLRLDHKCHTEDKSCPGGAGCVHRACVRPEHMDPVSDLQNVHRGRLTKVQESDMARVYELRVQGMSWRKIAPMFGVTHAPLVTRMRAYCERNGLAWP